MAKAVILNINIERLECMLELFKMTKDELIREVNKNNNKKDRPISLNDINKNIKKNVLTRIDIVFGRGLSYYTDPNPPVRNASILYRKANKGNKLEIGDMRLILKKVNEISYINGLKKLGNITIKPKLKQQYSLKDSPKEVAENFNHIIKNIKNTNNDKKFLENFIQNLAEYGILVLEDIEHSRIKYKSNLLGFFIKPNVIVIKRQMSFKREIFTLAHEFGHYLLDIEDVDRDILNNNKNDEEKWCNDFAFHLLAGNITEELSKINENDIDDNNATITELSKNNNVSKLAIFYYYANQEKISWEKFNSIKGNIAEKYTKQKETKKLQSGYTKQPKPIISALHKDIYVNAYFDGIIDEYTIINHFNIENGKLDKFLYE